MVFFTGKNGYTRTRELRTRTRPVRHLPVPDLYPRVRVGSGIPAAVRVDPHTSMSGLSNLIVSRGRIIFQIVSAGRMS